MLRPLFLCLLSSIVFLIAPLKPAFSGNEAPPTFSIKMLEVTVNQENTQTIAFFLEDEKGQLAALKSDLEKWRFLVKGKETFSYEGQLYIALSQVEGLTYQVDEANLTLALTAPATAFAKQQLDIKKKDFLMPSPPPPGAYVNYDVLLQQGGQKNKQLGGLFSANIFNGYGTGFCDFVAQYRPHSRPDNTQSLVRLNTNWQVDDPQRMYTLIFGDSYTVPGSWGRAAGFGGIQWGTNFSTQPGFISFPLPSVKGESSLPSVVDLFINDARSSQQNAGAGPFNIESIPVTTGAGTLNVVTTDLLGRQQSIQIPYYASSQLLKEGLHNFSYAAGWIRENFGLSSHDYTKFAATAHHEYGISDVLTAEAHGEFLAQQQTAGVGGRLLIGHFGVVNLSGAISHRKGQNGGLAMAGFQRQAFNSFNFGVNFQIESKNFAQMGVDEGQGNRQTLTAFAGVTLHKGASLGISYVQQNTRSSADSRLLSLNYNQSLGTGWSANLSALTNLIQDRSTSFFFTMTYALAPHTTLNVGGQKQQDGAQGTLQIQRSLPIGPGFGYNFYAAGGQNPHYQGAFTGQTDYGTYTAAATYHAHTPTGQLQTQGAVAFLENSFYFSRNLGQSFAVVQVPGQKNVAVYAHNQLVGHTNDAGTVLVPRLLPYQENPIYIEAKDLPLNAHIEKTHHAAVPWYRSGVFIDFPLISTRSALMKLIFPAGTTPPAGSRLTLNKKEFFLGYEGEAYITGVEDNNELILETEKKVYRCPFAVPQTDHPIPHLGDIPCKEF